MSFASDDRRPRILVAEDNYLMAQEVGDFVLGCGYTLAGAAASVEGGLALIANSPLDGAVLDIDLAGEPSFPMCEALDAKGVPFVFLSAYSSASTLVPLKFRTAPHIDKPFEPSRLKSVLEAMVHVPAVATEAPTYGNAVLDLLGDAERLLLQPSLERITYRLGERLEAAGRPARYVYFPVEGLISIFAGATPGTRIEIANVGCQGMTAPGALLGETGVASELVVQVPGSAWRIATATLQRLSSLHPALQRRLLEQAGVALRQIVEGASYNGRATITERLARWLLQASFRLGTRQLAITHEALSEMLGVRRPSISTGLQLLEGRHLIRSTRRLIVLLDLEGLARLARR